MNFFTSFKDPLSGFFETRRKRIAIQYLKCYFFIDFLSIATLWTGYHRDFYEWTYPLRLLRILRYVVILNQFEIVIKALSRKVFKKRSRNDIVHYSSLVSFILLFTIFFHYLACCFLYIGFQMKQVNKEPSWIEDFDYEDIQFKNFFTAIYYVIYTFSTVGFGDVLPYNIYEIAYTWSFNFVTLIAFSMVSGKVNYAAASRR